MRDSRTDLSLSPTATKIDSVRELGDMIGERRDQMFRYIRLTKLIPSLLQMVAKAAFRCAPLPICHISHVMSKWQLSKPLLI